jgi:ubiquinone/menaquinone biosynthesis C-methylase UbiE
MNYYKYWNDIRREENKPYYIEDKSDYKLLNFLEKETNLKTCFEDAIKFASTIGEIKGRVIDVGVGVAWTSALLSRIQSVQSVVGMDFSEHRLMKIAPIVFDQLEGEHNKFVPVLGEFINYEFEELFDVVIFCQSLYMFPDLEETLAKTRDILMKGGLLIVACERIVVSYPFYSPYYFRNKIKQFIRGRADTSGNYRYEDKEYRSAIKDAGFKYYFQLLDYPIFKGVNSIAAGNHFGVKL